MPGLILSIRRTARCPSAVNTPTIVTFNFTATTAVVPPSRELAEGWNGIGTTFNEEMGAELSLVSIDSDYSHLIGWNALDQSYTEPGINGIPEGEPFSNADFTMVPGLGYWLFVTEDTILASLIA